MRSTVQVCAEVGVTYRQLDWWCRSGLVPGQEKAGGSGSIRHFTDEQVARVGRLAVAARIRAMSLSELETALARGRILTFGLGAQEARTA